MHIISTKYSLLGVEPASLEVVIIRRVHHCASRNRAGASYLTRLKEPIGHAAFGFLEKDALAGQLAPHCTDNFSELHPDADRSATTVQLADVLN